DSPHWRPPTGTHPAAWPASGPAWIDPQYGDEVRRSQRPKRVKIACWLTWVASGLVAYSYAMWLIGFVLMPDTFIPMLMRWLDLGYVNFTSSSSQWVYVLIHLAVFVWTLSACALAWLAWRRVRWAAFGLMFSAAVALPLCLVAFPLSFFQLFACPAVIVLLWLARPWYAVARLGPTKNANRISIQSS
ncbi:MAG TPA: hypothetical protein PKA04_07295, partial [Marmoricola sp.]|nr:hypothetical protein [Marmoricola sp.]